MEGIEVEGLVDVLILSFRLTVGRAVVPRVVQSVDLTIFTSGYKGVLLDGVQILCRGEAIEIKDKEVVTIEIKSI